MKVSEKKINSDRGNFDGVAGNKLHGWAWRDGGGKLRLDLLVNGRAFARVTADKYREDLKRAGIGDGYCAFEYEIPDDFLDEKKYEFGAVVADSGYRLPGNDNTFIYKKSSSGELICLEWSSLVGWVNMPKLSGAAAKLLVKDGNSIIGSFLVDLDEGGVSNYRYVLPEQCLDGRPHLFKIIHEDSSEMVGKLAVITPAFLTPITAIQKYAGPYFMGYLSPSGHSRYESLRLQVNRLLAEGVSENLASDLRGLIGAHEQVISGFEKKNNFYNPIIFNKIDAPDVSIVIPAHNKFEVTYNALASILLAHNSLSYEIVLVDDGSEDETLEASQYFRNIKIHRNDVAQGFVKASNAGAKLAVGEYVVMLNNDTEVTSGWLDELVGVFYNFDNVGMSGAKFLYGDGSLQEAGGIVWGNGEPWNYGRNGNPREPKYNYCRDVDYISGACIMLKREVWEQLGGFDEFFAPAYYEDTDLAFRVRSLGLRTIYTPFCEIYHFEGVSNGVATTGGLKRYQLLNAPKFKSRWVSKYKKSGRPSLESADFAKDRNIERRVLFIDNQTPSPDKDAGSYAAIQEMKIFQGLGFKVTFIPENLSYLAEYTKGLQRIGIECIYAPFVLSVNELLEKRGREFDVVYITRYQVAQNVVDGVRKWASHAKILFNNADLHFLREMRAAISKNNKELLDAAAKTRDQELAVMRTVDVVLSYNKIEHVIIQSHNLDQTKVALCPWVVDTVENIPNFTSRDGIAFLGGYGHPPNVEAIEFFVEKVMPLLRLRIPGVNFLVYGSNVPDSFAKYESDDVLIKGWVKDVKDVYDTCRVFVAPLLSGAGVKGKVIGALAHGVPTVLSPIAAEGLDVRDGGEVLMANSPEDWVEAISTLYTDAASWESISGRSRKFVAGNYSRQVGLGLMRDALRLAGYWI